MRILYLTHDLSDPMTKKRVRMLADGGATVCVAGFRREAAPVESVSGVATTNFGRTHNGKFFQRMVSVLREVVLLARHRAIFREADMVIARNLEMLAIGVRGRALNATRPTLVYECLDIHRLMLNDGVAGKALRCLEGWLAKRAALLMTSSPAFIREYFEKRSRVRLPMMLLENKVYTPSIPSPTVRPDGPVWRIGWFGAIRCAKSLALLCGLAKQCPGLVEVIIRGRPAYDQLPGFEHLMNTTPGVHFLGAYTPEDLQSMYGEVHFTWTIDMFEEGLNSSWLLPNRIYEGGLYGSVPLAAQGVETSRFLESLGIGMTLEEPKDVTLRNFFTALMNAHYRTMQARVSAIPPHIFACDTADCIALVASLRALTVQKAMA